MSNAMVASAQEAQEAQEASDAFWSGQGVYLARALARAVAAERDDAAAEAAEAAEAMGADLALTDETLSFGVTFGGRTREVTVAGWGLLADEAMVVAAREGMGLATMANYSASAVFFTEAMSVAVVQIGGRRCVVRAR